MTTVVFGSGTLVTSNIGRTKKRKLEAGGKGSTVDIFVVARKALPIVTDAAVVMTGPVGICQCRGLPPTISFENGADRTR